MKFFSLEQPRTKRSRATRICIGKAIVSLMEEIPFDQIRVTDIVRRAGVSRMTYYKYYTSKLDALSDFLDEIVLEYDEEQKGLPSPAFFEKAHIYHAICFFERCSPLFLTLVHAGQYTVLAHAISHYTDQYILPATGQSGYAPYYYVGGFINVFFKWLEDGKQESCEELAEIIWQMISRR